MEALKWVMARKGRMSLLEGDPGLCIVLYFCSLFFFGKRKYGLTALLLKVVQGFVSYKL